MLRGHKMNTVETWTNIAIITATCSGFGMLAYTIISLRTSVEQFNEQIQMNVFMDYTKRYQEIVLNFPKSINNKNFDYEKIDADIEKNMKIKEKTLRYMRAYFDLCSEEYFLHNEGKIDDNTWREWESGIKYTFSKTAFKKGWKIISLDVKYYPKFFNFVEEEMSE